MRLGLIAPQGISNRYGGDNDGGNQCTCRHKVVFAETVFTQGIGWATTSGNDNIALEYMKLGTSLTTMRPWCTTTSPSVCYRRGSELCWSQVVLFVWWLRASNDLYRYSSTQLLFATVTTTTREMRSITRSFSTTGTSWALWRSCMARARSTPQSSRPSPDAPDNAA